MEKEIPYGYCHCGCGKKTVLSKYSLKSDGRIKGQPIKYIVGHNRKILKIYCSQCHINNRLSYSTLCSECNKIVSAKYRRKRSKDSLLRAARLNRLKLTDSYIRATIKNHSDININQITIEMIELMRKYIILKRLIRNTKLKGEQYVECIGNSGSTINTNQGA